MAINKKISMLSIVVFLLSVSLASFCGQNRVVRYHPVFEQGQFVLWCPAGNCPVSIKRDEEKQVRKAMADHLKNSHSPRCLPSPTCAVCNNTFTVFTSLFAHYRRHLDMPSHACSYCGVSFLNSSDLKGHDAICGPRTTIPHFFALANPNSE